jgi:Domain of unknown function (DUF4276)
LTVRIAILVEGATEIAFKRALVDFLTPRLPGNMPKLDFLPEHGRLPKHDKLKRKVELLLRKNDAVIALTDVYTGTTPPDFTDANDAKTKMKAWVGDEPKFHPHAAQYDFEAWLLPYWLQIQRLAGSDRQCPSLHPENVNHARPPARHLADVFRVGSNRRRYSKPRDATAILSGQDLSVSAEHCPELKAFLNTILQLSAGQTL